MGWISYWRRTHPNAKPQTDIIKEATVRYSRAIDLRKAGWTYTAIGKELGLSSSRVGQIIHREMRRIKNEYNMLGKKK